MKPSQIWNQPSAEAPPPAFDVALMAAITPQWPVQTRSQDTVVASGMTPAELVTP